MRIALLCLLLTGCASNMAALEKQCFRAGMQPHHIHEDGADRIRCVVP